MREDGGDYEAGDTTTTAEINDAGSGGGVLRYRLSEAERVPKVLLEGCGTDGADLLRVRQDL